jgi:hypothetical protein
MDKPIFAPLIINNHINKPWFLTII